MQTINQIIIHKDFTDSPGARYRTDGDFSGQEFYEDLLLPKFEKAVKNDGILMVDVDDTWGFASSFISGSFGLLSHKKGKEAVKKHLQLQSNDPILIKKINKEIEAPNYS